MGNTQLMKPNRREWDEDVIKSCLYPIDAEEVLEIRLTERERDEDDYSAWHYERSGMFSVRSAYKIALEADQAEMRQVGSTTRADRSRSLYNEIWMAQVPPKV
jgi:hypothetical protein